MDNAVHAEDSNSANVKSTFHLLSVECSSRGVYKLTTSTGHSLSVRAYYLQYADQDLFYENSFLTEEETDDIIRASMCTIVEVLACQYIVRSEHCSYGLQIKLQRKGYALDIITSVLLFLSEHNYIDDMRFSQAWLRNRIIHQYEGRQCLIGGLISRGISRTIAHEAVDDFFKMYPESDLFKNALEKCRKYERDNNRLIRSLLRKGFSYSEITKNIKPKTVF